LHRDLKPPNVLFDNHGVAKIADFGLSKFVGDSLKPYRMTAKTGTVRYMAPEVLLGKKYDISVDVYSFGWIMSYMFSGTRPFHNFSIKMRVDYAKNGIQPRVPYNLPASLSGIIQRCVSNDRHERLSTFELTEKLEKLSLTK